MKIQPLAYLLIFISVTAFSACTSTGSKKHESNKVAEEQKNPTIIHHQSGRGRGVGVSDTPQPAATPGGYWPPLPEPAIEKLSKSKLTAPAITTDMVDLNAKRDPKTELSRRVVERWALLIARRGEEAYNYLTPGYQKTHDRAQYGSSMNNRPVRWFRATYHKADCASETSCEVTVYVEYNVRIAAAMGITQSFAFIKESWLKLEDIWYHLKDETGG